MYLFHRLRVDLANKKPKIPNEDGGCPPGSEKKNQKMKEGGESDDEKESDEEGGGSRDVTNPSNDTLDDVDPDASEVSTKISIFNCLHLAVNSSLLNVLYYSY